MTRAELRTLQALRWAFPGSRLQPVDARALSTDQPIVQPIKERGAS